MKPSEIISLARRQTGCTEDIVTTEEAFRFLNFVIEDFGAEIRASDSGYGFNILEINVTGGQPTYTYNQTNGNYMEGEDYPIGQPYPLHKIQSVWLKDKDGKWYDLPVHFVDKVDVQKFISQKEPRACFITSNEINLIPTPKESTQMQIWGWSYNPELSNVLGLDIVVGDNIHSYKRTPEMDVAGATNPYAWSVRGKTYRYTHKPIPSVGESLYDEANNPTETYTIVSVYTYYDNEKYIFIDKRWHYIIVEGLKYRMYGNMGVNFETARTNSRAFYDSEKIKAIQNIMDRGQLADTAYFPDLNFLNY